MNNEELSVLADMVAERSACYQKNVLTAVEASRYMGITLAYLYKLTSACALPYYKPSGKLIYLKREDLDAYMMQNRNATVDEMMAAAAKKEVMQ